VSEETRLEIEWLLAVTTRDAVLREYLNECRMRRVPPDDEGRQSEMQGRRRQAIGNPVSWEEREWDTEWPGVLTKPLLLLRGLRDRRRRDPPLSATERRQHHAMEQEALKRLADNPLLVSSVARIRSSPDQDDRAAVIQFIREDDGDERIPRVRRTMLPTIRQWAVRQAWADAQTGPQRFRLAEQGPLRTADPLKLEVADFGQWFHQRAMHHVATLLIELARRWQQVEMILKVVAPGSTRELDLLRVLVEGSSSRHMAAMLGTTRGALRTRLARRKRVTPSA
jgi:hypothetical protein